MEVKFKLTKLDRRHTGYLLWQYYVERVYTVPYREAKRLFFDWREWCWEQWGPSKELNNFEYNDLFDGMHSSNPHWCWLNDSNHRCRIYLRTEQEASMFTLKWYG